MLWLCKDNVKRIRRQATDLKENIKIFAKHISEILDTLIQNIQRAFKTQQ